MKFCPECGKALILLPLEGRERPTCAVDTGGCGFIDFGRYSLGVGGLVISEENGIRRALLIQRNQEPNRGAWTIPGGFVASDETAEIAVVREVKEETGLECEVVGLVGYRNRSEPRRNDSYVVFLLRRVGGNLTSEPTDEIMTARYYSPEEMDRLTRLAPLSRTLAEAAIRETLYVLHASRVTSLLPGVPPMTLFMG